MEQRECRCWLMHRKPFLPDKHNVGNKRSCKQIYNGDTKVKKIGFCKGSDLQLWTLNILLEQSKTQLPANWGVSN